MNKDITLVVLAAGMGRRFGGLKQITPMGPNDEFIIDYGIYDAIRVGFTKIVFLIQEENYQVFKETIGSRVDPYIKVEYCFQKNNNLPEGYESVEHRVKPFGTAHAILCVRDVVKEPFMIINADDFYGYDAFLRGAEFLKNVDGENHYGLVGYLVENTITENGSVKRGICNLNGDKLESIIESIVEKVNGEIIASPLSGSDDFVIEPCQTVSMNMLLFTPSIFKYIEDGFGDFFDKNKNNLDKCEYLIPDVLQRVVKKGYADVTVLPTNSMWYGVTYKEDTQIVISALNGLVEDGIYPRNLWK